MKATKIIVASIIFSTIGCKSNTNIDKKENYITVDVTKNYKKKELIIQDFMDVEYIQIETTDESVTQGIVMDIGKKIIIVRNRTSDGNIYIFDKKGKSIRKINKMGQSGEEYIFYLSGGFVLDEDKNEIYINDGIKYSFIVYDLYGNFKRRIRYKEGPFITNVFNYNDEYVLCMEDFWPQYDSESHKNSFFLISKKNGHTKDVKIPFNKKISTMSIRQNEEGNIIDEIGPSNCLITPFQNGWILTEPSSDTIYRYSSEEKLIPFIVRSPSIQSMNPEIFLFPGVLTDRYYFMQTVKKEIKWDTDTRMELPTTDLVYDKQEKSIFQYTVKNADFTDKNIDMSIRAVNDNAFYFILESYELIEAYEKGKLKGKLKEIAQNLDGDSNPIIMIIKHKERN